MNISSMTVRKSKKTEKSNRPPMDENVSVAHHSKRSKEKSPSKKRSADLQGVNAHVQSPRPGLSC